MKVTLPRVGAMLAGTSVAVVLVALGAILGAGTDQLPGWVAATLAASSLVAALAAVAAAVFEFQAARDANTMASEAMTMEQRLRTIEYCSQQLEREPVRRARAWMDGNRPPDAEAVQDLRQLAHSCNRIGAGVRLGALSPDVVHGLWSQDWFARHWAAVHEHLLDGREGDLPYPDFQDLAGRPTT